MTRKIIAIVPAAGVGQRAASAANNQPKQYRLIAGQPMLRHAVQALLADPRIDQVRVVVAQGDTWVAPALAGLPRTVWRYCGGASRTQTVIGGLEDAALGPGDWVLVHDAARPGLPCDALARLIDICLQTGHGGLLALPVADTVKRQRQASANGLARETAVPDGAGCTEMPYTQGSPSVLETIERDGLWLAQTPQMFRAGLLLDALRASQAAGIGVTDEASAIEYAGQAALLVKGSVRNLKVTWPDDFALIENYLS